MRNSSFVTKWSPVFASALAVFWIFILPLLTFIAPQSIQSLILMGVGAILAALSNVVYLIVLLVRKQETSNDISSAYPPGSLHE